MRRRYERALVVGLLVSVLIHVALVLAWRAPLPQPHSPFSAAGPPNHDDRAARGGGMREVRLSYATPITPPAPPVAVPVPDAVVPPTPQPKLQPHVKVQAAPIDIRAPAGTVGQGDLKGQGPGRADGTGRGAGGTEESGAYHGVPPTPRGMILPPADRPKGVRGKQIAVWVFVNAAGRVIPDSTRLMPPTGNNGFDKRLRQLAAEWVFVPGRRDGHAVAEWFRYVLVL